MSKREEEETARKEDEVAHERPTPATSPLLPFLVTLPDPEPSLARSSNQLSDNAILILDGGLESFVFRLEHRDLRGKGSDLRFEGGKSSDEGRKGNESSKLFLEQSDLRSEDLHPEDRVMVMVIQGKKVVGRRRKQLRGKERNERAGLF